MRSGGARRKPLGAEARARKGRVVYARDCGRIPTRVSSRLGPCARPLQVTKAEVDEWIARAEKQVLGK